MNPAYYLSRHSYKSEQSILNLMTSKVLPLLIARPDRPHAVYTILNSGSIRFDVFKGPFTRNDQVRLTSLQHVTRLTRPSPSQWIILPFSPSEPPLALFVS